MKNLYIGIIFLMAVVMLAVPVTVLPESGPTKKATTEVESIGTANKTSEKVEKTEKTAKSSKSATKIQTQTVRLLISKSGKVSKIPMKEYLFGVVAGECPMDYHDEALKAQVIAAHSYTLYRITANKSQKYDLSDDPETSQFYRPRKEALKVWGSSANANEKRLDGIINSVEHYVVTYKNKPILAVYHAMSGGITEDSKNVWGGEVAYLKATESLNDKSAANYLSQVKVEKADADAKLFSKKITAEELIGAKVTKSPSGYVLNCRVGEVTLTGGDITALFGLKSSNFDMNSDKDGGIIFTVRGSGHGVGMSQNGANMLAEKGKTYSEILLHYYKNCTLSKIE